MSERCDNEIHIVLVEPNHPGNIGATARAMKTMGLSSLILVRPTRFPDPQADWRAAGEAEQKIKKDGSGQPPALALVENPDILQTLSQMNAGRPKLVVGFAAETENVIDQAKSKRARKGCDWIVANNVGSGAGVMGGDKNTVHLVTDSGIESWPTMAKDEVALALAKRIASHFGLK